MALPSFPRGELYGDDYLYDEEPERIFDPRSNRMYRDVPADQLIAYDSTKQVRQLRLMNPYTKQTAIDSRTVVVSIDGACRGNGTPSARAGWGVYFGPQSGRNSSGILDAALPQTSTRAEIEALSQALDIIRNDVSKDYSLLNYHIRTDSSYLVQTFSAYIHDWIDNGGRNAQGKRAAHFDILKKIHERLDDMTYGDDGGMAITFWLVPREENKEADALANQALDKGAGANMMAANAKLRPLANEPLGQRSEADKKPEKAKSRGLAGEACGRKLGAKESGENVKPRVLSVSLNHLPFFDSVYGSLLNKIRAGAVFQRVEDGQSAKRMLSEEPRPRAVLITDEALTLRENAPVWDAVLKYVRQGGTAVFMGNFSSFVQPMSLRPFFAKAGLDWSSGSYHRTTLALNPQAVGAHLTRLVPEYSQKALFLRHTKPSDAWYVTDSNSVLESSVFGAEDVHNPGESPVLFARVGNGRLGYIGDVNGEEGSEAAVLAMCGL